IVCRQEADQGDEQQARIELAAAEALCEGVALAVESPLANRRVHAIADFAPGFQRSRKLESLGIAHRAIERHPGHDLGEGKVATTASHFPDSFVRLLPDLLKMLDQLLLQRPPRPDGSKAERSSLAEGVNQLAADAEL